MSEIINVPPKPDSNVAAVCELLRSREAVGLKKYGVTTDRKDLSPAEWLTELRNELLDGAVYAQKLISELTRDDLRPFNE